MAPRRMADPSRALGVLKALSAMGVRISIDDFGAGYSSLSYLTSFPVHELKIDGSFIRQLQAGNRNAAVVRSTIDLGHRLGLAVVRNVSRTKHADAADGTGLRSR